MDSEQTCIHAFVSNTPAITEDCVFQAIPNVAQTHCANYLAPEAAFVTQNYINYWQGIRNHFFAIGDAGDAIFNTTFIDDVVSGLAPQPDSVLVAVLELLAGLAVAVLPVGGEILAAGDFISAVGVILKKSAQDLVTNSANVVRK